MSLQSRGNSMPSGSVGHLPLLISSHLPRFFGRVRRRRRLGIRRGSSLRWEKSSLTLLRWAVQRLCIIYNRLLILLCRRFSSLSHPQSLSRSWTSLQQLKTTTVPLSSWLMPQQQQPI